MNSNTVFLVLVIFYVQKWGLSMAFISLELLRWDSFFSKGLKDWLVLFVFSGCDIYGSNYSNKTQVVVCVHYPLNTSFSGTSVFWWIFFLPMGVHWLSAVGCCAYTKQTKKNGNMMSPRQAKSCQAQQPQLLSELTNRKTELTWPC